MRDTWEMIIGCVIALYLLFMMWGVWFGNDDDNE